MAEINSVEDLLHGRVTITSGVTAIGGGLRAHNYPAETGDPKFSHIIFNETPGDVWEQWVVSKVDGGYTIQNVGTHYWARVYGEVNGSPDFDPKWCTFSIESAGSGIFKIKIPNIDEVWTVKERGPGFPLTVFLTPANGEKNQLFAFHPVSEK